MTTSVGPTLVVRPAVPDDLDGITRMEVGPDTTSYLGVTGRDYHLAAFADADQEHLVAVVGTTVGGFVLLAGLRDGGGRVELRRVVLDHGIRGRGHGRAMFRAAVAHAFERHDARSVWLDVKPYNHRAQALYVSEGFRPDGTIPDPQHPGGVLLLMTRARDDRAAATESED
ncbi:GNAT family N-acetyltransferase [Micromonospora sp. WMMD987]|uniref:GNAT family N-acetyltransferase n=1 Tax=Micromonospora TaxID=1873 RepID=UPI00249BC58B|nr:GNAT family N-acetyltransferase [Micromonospora sp. WMMD987]WFE96100.1 GNAT family N-acetyltransferase [Micromonospora sp. WMMD987]